MLLKKTGKGIGGGGVASLSGLVVWCYNQPAMIMVAINDG